MGMICEHDSRWTGNSYLLLSINMHFCDALYFTWDPSKVCLCNRHQIYSNPKQLQLPKLNKSSNKHMNESLTNQWILCAFSKWTQNYLLPTTPPQPSNSFFLCFTHSIHIKTDGLIIITPLPPSSEQTAFTILQAQFTRSRVAQNTVFWTSSMI